MTKVSELVSQNVGNAIINYQTWGGIIFNVIAYGADPKGVKDSTIAIQAAINAAAAAGGGVVFFPPGNYLVSATITITSQYVRVKGSGKYTTIILRKTDYGDTFYFNCDNLYGNGMSDLAILQQGIDMTTGAHLRVRGGVEGDYYNLTFGSGNIGVWVQGSARNNFYNIWCSHPQGSNGAAYYQIEKDAALVINTPTSLKFDQCDGLGLNAAGNVVTYGWYIKAADGIDFSNCHAQDCKTASLFVNGTGTTKLVSLQFANCYFDQNGKNACWIAGVSVSNFGGFQFTNCIFRSSVNAPAISIQDNVALITFTNCEIRESQLQGVIIDATAGGYNFYGCNFLYNNSLSNASSYDIVISPGVSHVNVKNCVFNRNGVGGAISLAAGAIDYIVISNSDMSAMAQANTAKILDSGATGNNNVFQNNFGHVAAAIASAATINPSTAETFHVTGTTNITSMNVRPAGVRLYLIFDGALTINAGAILKLRANTTTYANYCLSLVSDGTAWYQIGT